ncbi:MAG: (Fe-S)-binding protein [Bacteroidales bacterium]
MRERVAFDPFVLPFCIGLLFILGYLGLALVRVLAQLTPDDRKKLFSGLFSRRIFWSVREIFMECLIHKRIFSFNPLLGYMHMSIAFGWFMLIVLGHIEVLLYAPNRLNLYYPIFFRYFVMQTEETLRGGLFFFLMDFFLLMTLSGIALALYKRINSRIMGMRRTTRLRWGDRIAMYALWLIFPLRLLAESFTSGIGGGSFLTRGFGLIFEQFVANTLFIQPIWWAYSLALGIFFFALPFSRYMHIPTEILLILLRNAGIRSFHPTRGYAKVELYSCSRCGLCIDTCQMVSAGRMEPKATAYFIHAARHHAPDAAVVAENCLMCGRCVEVCPVNIDSCRLKQATRNLQDSATPGRFAYLETQATAPRMNEGAAPEPKVLYFAGCMTHLTPSIPRAMEQLFKAAKQPFDFMDRDGSICCGRPLMLTGKKEDAALLVAKNKALILASGAETLVTSCPICYRIFREEYQLPVKVLHHTEYLEQLLLSEKIHVNRKPLRAVYHDPCELGRYSKIYDAPRRVLEEVVRLSGTDFDRENGLCCGGSIANVPITASQRKKIARDAVKKLTLSAPDYLVTSCPLCQKTLGAVSETPTVDIAVLVAGALVEEEHASKIKNI